MSSFVKLKRDGTEEIAGVKTSIRNGQIVSSGSDSFNFVIGGGIEINSIILIGEDKYGKYSDALTKLFLADGFHHKHHLFFASLDDDPRKTMREIPMAHESQTETKPEETTASNDLRIAFRYQDLPKIDSVQRGSQSSITYDLTKKYDKELIDGYEKASYFSFDDLKKSQKSAYESVIEDLKKIVSKRPNLLRVCIAGLGSPLWYTESFSQDLILFLTQLKSIARYNNVVCFLTMPLHLISLIDDHLIFRIRKLVDCNVNLESFNNVEKQTNAVFKQYHGLLHIKKMQTIAALQSHKSEAFDLAFKLKSNRFVIEKLHLPPELQENESSEVSMSCSSSGGNKSLDF